jgi:hypothetical protein
MRTLMQASALTRATVGFSHVVDLHGVKIIVALVGLTALVYVVLSLELFNFLR